MGADDVTKQMAKRQAGKVQGTDADLRRMTTAQAKERLRCAAAACCTQRPGRPSRAAPAGLPAAERCC